MKVSVDSTWEPKKERFVLITSDGAAHEVRGTVRPDGLLVRPSRLFLALLESDLPKTATARHADDAESLPRDVLERALDEVVSQRARLEALGRSRGWLTPAAIEAEP